MGYLFKSAVKCSFPWFGKGPVIQLSGYAFELPEVAADGGWERKHLEGGRFGLCEQPLAIKVDEELKDMVWVRGTTC